MKEQKIYHSKTGDYKIIKDLGRDNNTGKYMVQIQYIDEDIVQTVRKDHAMCGNVRKASMRRGRIPDKIDFKTIYETTKSGPVKILKEIPNNDGSRLVEIQFIESGNTQIVDYYKLKDTGNILDKTSINK